MDNSLNSLLTLPVIGLRFFQTVLCKCQGLGLGLELQFLTTTLGNSIIFLNLQF